MKRLKGLTYLGSIYRREVVQKTIFILIKTGNRAY